MEKTLIQHIFFCYPYKIHQFGGQQLCHIIKDMNKIVEIIYLEFPFPLFIPQIDRFPNGRQQATIYNINDMIIKIHHQIDK